jgi:hypothetical protein
MTTRLLSFDTLRNVAAARRRGNLSGNWSNIADRDLHRTAVDLLAMSYDDGHWADKAVKVAADPVTPPVDLDIRRARSAMPTTPAATTTVRHARAS